MKTFRPCVIHVGSSEALSAAVQRELSGRNVTSSRYNGSGHWPYMCLWADGEWLGSRAGDSHSEWPRFDAATQFGALLEYLDKPEEVNVELENCESVEIFPAYAVLWFTKEALLRRSDGMVFTLEEVTKLKAAMEASQAARKEGK